jgi:peptidoglycan/LPS O-acetylase OafA/YrhL
MNITKNRINEADYLREFAIIAVILIHVTANFSSLTNINDIVIINPVYSIKYI